MRRRPRHAEGCSGNRWERLRRPRRLLGRGSRKLIPGALWARNFDAFNDILRGGFGTPDGGFVLRWLHSARSRERLGFPETIRYLEAKVLRCHPENVPYVKEDLAAARRGEGMTVFDILVEIIRCHGGGGDEAVDGVALELA